MWGRIASDDPGRLTPKARLALLVASAVCSTVAVSIALADGRLLQACALVALILALIAELTGLTERWAIVRRLADLSALVGVVLVAVAVYLRFFS